MTDETRREGIEAAFDKLSDEVESAPEPVAESPPEPVEAAPTEAASEAVTETAAEKAQRARDESGKFTKAKAAAPTVTKAPVPGVPDKTQAPVAAAKPTATPAPVQGAQTPTFKPPQSWKPAAREEWAKVPPAVQEEIDRRERETARTLQESASVRQQWGHFQQAVSPYVGMIQAEGGDVMGTVSSLLQTAAALRTAPPGHKAQLIAGIVKQFGIPIEALDEALSGQQVSPQHSQSAAFDPNQVVQMAEQRIMQRLSQQRTQATESRAVADLQSFESSNPEFLSDVRDDMADIMETRARRGLQISFEDAYNLACKLHPEISSVLEQRKAASQANANNASTQRALRASSSVRSQPTTVVTTDGPQSRRDEVSAVFDKLAGR